MKGPQDPTEDRRSPIDRLIQSGIAMSLILPRLSRLSDERDRQMVSGLISTWDKALKEVNAFLGRNQCHPSQ